MVVIYSLALVVGIVGLLIVIFGSSFADNVDRPDRDPGSRLGMSGKIALGAVLGFGAGGMAAEFSPLDLTWQVALVIALAAGLVSAWWVRYSVSQAEQR